MALCKRQLACCSGGKDNICGRLVHICAAVIYLSLAVDDLGCGLV